MDEPDTHLDESPSKSERKRHADALRGLARRLVRLPRHQHTVIALPEEVHDAILEWHRIRSREAQRRQIQRIGKLLREADTESITHELDRLDPGTVAYRATQHAAERWRDRLLTEGDTAVAEFMASYPDANSQHLRQLLRNARREADRGQSGRAGLALFRLVKSHCNGPTGPPDGY